MGSTERGLGDLGISGLARTSYVCGVVLRLGNAVSAPGGTGWVGGSGEGLRTERKAVTAKTVL